jgi:hypothetical protein
MMFANPAVESGADRALVAGQPAIRGAARPAAPRTLEIDGSRWRSQRDFYDALSARLGSVERTCRSSETFLESMIYHLDLNAEQPPYQVVIRNPRDEFRPFLSDFAQGVAEARHDRSADPRWGGDVEVAITVA